MVVPIAKLLDTSFKNLSLSPNNLLGAVELVIDPATPVDAVRAQLVDICTASPKWDKNTCVLQVIDANEKGATIRALVSSAHANDLFLLRCEVREKLLAFLRDLDNGRYYANQRHHPSHGAPVPAVPGASRPSAATS
jgi:hypothetical protein